MVTFKTRKTVGGERNGTVGRPKGCKLLNKVNRTGCNQQRFGHRMTTTSTNKIKDTPIKHGYHLEDYNRQCVYLHYYDNEEQPFYVGQGTIGRAFAFAKRTTNYYNKVKDVNLIKVKIHSIDITPNEGIKIETELISKYKFESDGGSLVNIEVGGRGGSRGKYKDNKLSKPVLQLDKYGNIIKRWDSAAQARDIAGFDASTITKCCRHIPKYNSHKGFKWEYEGD